MFQRLFFVFSSTIWTCVTCLPYRLLYLTYLSFAEAKVPGTRMNTVLVYLITAFFPIVVVGIVINPWITILTQRMYRECLLLYFRKIGSVFGIHNVTSCAYQSTKTRRQSRPSIATQRSSAAFSECKRLNEIADV